MIPQGFLIHMGIIVFLRNYVSAQSQFFVYVKVHELSPIKWQPYGYGNQALCSLKCVWTECPGFHWDNHTCFLLEPNQTLPMATGANGVQVFIRNDLIHKVESVVAYNGDTFHEYMPSNSPLHGFPTVFPNHPLTDENILMDFPWGFHMCYIIQKSCFRWYFGTDEWIPMPNLLYPHAEVRDMIRLNQTWWIMGGFLAPQQLDQHNYPHQITEYMDESGQWHEGPTYLKRYFEGIGKTSNTSVLVVGGTHTSSFLQNSRDVVSEFDGDQGFIGHRPTIFCPMHGVSCVDYVMQNGTKVVLCLGGNCPSVVPSLRSEVFIYNLDTQDWTTITEWEFPEPLSFSNLGWFQGKLWVLGARYGQSDRNTVFQFDETKQPAWTALDFLPDQSMEYSRFRTFTRSLIVV